MEITKSERYIKTREEKQIIIEQVASFLFQNRLEMYNIEVV